MFHIFFVENIICEWWTWYLAEISKQNVRRISKFLHAVYSEMWKERDKLKKKLLNKKKMQNLKN